MSLEALQSASRTDSALAGMLRTIVIALTAFLTVVDLFATQAILPTLTRHYDVSPGAMSTAVNASTFGMAASGLLVALFSRHIERRSGVLISLALLSVPTALLSIAPDLASFHRLAGDARPPHVGRLHPDTRLSRGALQRRRDRQRLCRLYHRQCREQSVRAIDVGGARRTSGPCREFPCLRASQSLGRAVGPFRTEEDSADAGDGRRAARAMGRPGDASGQSPAAGELRHRLPHPVRIRRHLHLCELRAGRK